NHYFIHALQRFTASSGASYGGLFAQILPPAEFKNLYLVNFILNDSATLRGSLAGRILATTDTFATSISNVHVNAALLTSDNVRAGLLIGEAQGVKFVNVSAYGSFHSPNGSSNIGGISGLGDTHRQYYERIA